jgi:ABC-type multidrug transport system fused ATPase/permease subunit
MDMGNKVEMPINDVLLLKRLWAQLDRESKKKFAKVFLLTVASSATEIITIGAAVPFLAVLTSPEIALSYIQKFTLFNEFFLDFNGDYKFWFVTLFGVAAVLAGLIRVWLLRSSSNLAFGIGAEISSKMFARALTRTYEEQCASSTTELIDAISIKSFNIVVIVQTGLSFLSNLFIFTTMILAIILVAPSYILYGAAGFILAYMLIVLFTRNRISANAEIVSQESLKAVSVVAEGFGAIRDIIIDGNVNYYIELFKKTELKLKSAQATNSILGNAPRYLMESLGLLAVAILGYQMTSSVAQSEIAIPMLGAIALAAQRLLPVLQQIYWGWSSIKSLTPALEQQLQLIELAQPMVIKAKIETKISSFESLEFRNVWFSYKGNEPILKGVSISIKAGEKIGVVGETGSGKSTFVDLIMGLLRPTEGEILINGMELWNDGYVDAWQSALAHVPQAIYLANSNVANNIAFGSRMEKIDKQKINDVAAKAKVNWVNSGGINILDQKVGENGAMLSGGQRQRIGIARALYKSAKLIVFDEATSALDQNTEKEIMNTVYEIDSEITLVIIAHRSSTLSGCDKILEIKDGGVNIHSSYLEYMARREK